VISAAGQQLYIVREAFAEGNDREGL
jgi:hypothetical protein